MAKTAFFDSTDEKSQIEVSASENNKLIQIFSSQNIGPGKSEKTVINLTIDDGMKLIAAIKHISNQIVLKQ